MIGAACGHSAIQSGLLTEGETMIFWQNQRVGWNWSGGGGSEDSIFKARNALLWKLLVGIHFSYRRGYAMQEMAIRQVMLLVELSERT